MREEDRVQEDLISGNCGHKGEDDMSKEIQGDGKVQDAQEGGIDADKLQVDANISLSEDELELKRLEEELDKKKTGSCKKSSKAKGADKLVVNKELSKTEKNIPDLEIDLGKEKSKCCGSSSKKKKTGKVQDQMSELEESITDDELDKLEEEIVKGKSSCNKKKN